MISRQNMPAVALKGVDSTLRLDFRSDDGTAATVDSATCTVYERGTVIATGAATVAAGLASFVLLGTLTAAKTVGPGSADWLVVWSDVVVSAPTLDAGTYQGIRAALVLANAPLLCPITDDDLTDDCPSLAEMVPPSDGTYEGFRLAAFRSLVRRLKRAGKIAALVLDADSLVDLLIADTLARIFREHTTSMGDARYSDLAKFYAARAAVEWDALVLRYDRNGNGTIDGADGEVSPGVGALYTARPPRTRGVRVGLR